MAIGKRVRFEVFKRDGFACRYCGANPMAAVLQVDHVVPISKGGTDDPANLVTSCQPCNSGKSNIELGDSRLPPTFDIELIKEHAEQTREYLAIQKEIIAIRGDVAIEIRSYWEKHTVNYQLTTQQMASIRRFCSQLSLSEIIDSIDTAMTRVECRNITTTGQSFKYFCGICWSKIKAEKAST